MSVRPDEETMSSSRPSVMTAAESRRAERVLEHAQRGADGVHDLLEMLVDPSWAVRRRVIQALAQMGEDAVVPLIEALRTRRDDETRIAATVDALSESVAAAEAAVIGLTQDENNAVVADGAQILGRRREASAVPRLAELTKHPDDNVAVAALEALGRVGGRAAVDCLVDAVRSGSFFRTFPAIDVLGRSGDPRAVKPLADLLPSPEYALEAARALGRSGDPAAVKHLVALLGHGSDTTVRVACSALADLQAAYTNRYGETGAIERAIREAAPPSASRNVVRALAPASFAEQQDVCWVLGALGSEDSVPALVELLDGTPAVARGAAAALDRIGRMAAQQVTEALRGGPSDVRRALLPAIASHMHSPDGVIACLSDPDPSVRAAACDALVRIASPAAVRPLFGRLGDPDPRVVQSATSAIQSLGSADTERLALEAATSESPAVRRSAFRVLAYFGYSSALDLFLAAIDGDDARLRDVAVQGLPFIEDPRALEAIFEVARHEEARARAAAMRALGQCREDLRVSSCLLRGLTDEDPWVRYYACQSLGKLGFEAAAEPIAALLDDAAGQVRVAAVEALSHLASDVARGILVQASRSADVDVRRAALLGLGIARRPDTLPILLEAASARDAATRLVAISAMAGFGDRVVLDALHAAARDSDESVRTAAIGFLAARPVAEATLRLIDLARAPQADPQAAAALGSYSPTRVRALVDALQDADDVIAPVLTSALARMHRPEAEEALLLVVERAGSPARRAAAGTLAAIGSSRAMRALRQRAEEDPDPEVKAVCASALSR